MGQKFTNAEEYSTKIITSSENHLSCCHENNAWGNHIDNDCYHGKLLVPKLQQIAKRVIRKCFECQWFHPKPFTRQQKSILPSDRATVIRPFQLIDTHFAGLIMYYNKKRGEKKTHILLSTCSLIRTVHVELLPDQTTDEFITALKRWTSRRGFSETLYSDNANIYVAVSKLINKSEILYHLLTTRYMK